ncbi:hypothetical protein VSU19_13690 [Verrucomicrobiales bacterium BCK34]|nr:hypothetical protein [Verrucomicrobiales bacterium BCK34]
MKALTLLPMVIATGLTMLNAEAQSSRNAFDVISGTVPSADLATFEESEALVWRELKRGVDCYGMSDRYQWETVPEELSDVRFSVQPMHSGELRVKVKSAGLVFIATSTRWKGGGNSSGDWLENAMDERGLRRAGWRPLRQIKEFSNNDTGEWKVFYRNAEAGESFSIRTEKYAAPVLLARYDTSLALRR